MRAWRWMSPTQATWASAEAEARAELEAAREEQRHSASEGLNVLKLSLEAQARLCRTIKSPHRCFLMTSPYVCLCMSSI